MKSIMFFLLFLLCFSCKKQTLLENYRIEISALKSNKVIEDYWSKLFKADQEALIDGKYTVREHDSISISHMLKAALLFEIHGDDIYKPNNYVLEPVLTHNYFGASNIAFWPIISKAEKLRGNQSLMMYPAYQLEGLGITFYDYSVFGKDEIYPDLLKKLNKNTNSLVSENLFEALNYQLKIHDLKVIEVEGKWRRQQIKDSTDERFFEFVEASDNKLYYKKDNRLQKLELVETKSDYKLYRVEKEPFGWRFKLYETNELSLLDDKGDVLISYYKEN